MPNHTKPITLEGRRILPLGRGSYIRDDGLIGLTNPHKYAQTLADFAWYTPAQLAERTGISTAQMKLRIRDRWGWADLVKPDGWERVVDAKRHGVPAPSGARTAWSQFRKEVGLSETALIYRLFHNWDWADLSRPTATRRRIAVAAEAAHKHPQAQTNAIGQPRVSSAPFYFNGALDTLAGHARSRDLEPYTVYQRLYRGATLEQALRPGRKTRKDKGKPNPRRGNRDSAANMVFPPRADGTPDLPPPEYVETPLAPEDLPAYIAASQRPAPARSPASGPDPALDEILGRLNELTG